MYLIYIYIIQTKKKKKIIMIKTNLLIELCLLIILVYILILIIISYFSNTRLQLYLHWYITTVLFCGLSIFATIGYLLILFYFDIVNDNWINILILNFLNISFAIIQVPLYKLYDEIYKK